MFVTKLVLASIAIITSYFVVRLLLNTSILYLLKKWWRILEDGCHVYQNFKIPEFNEHMQQNQLYQKVIVYLNSLHSVEDSDYVNLFAGNKPSEINLQIERSQLFVDHFLGARVYWQFEKNCLVLRIRRKDKRRILRPYLQNVHLVFDEITQRKNEVRLFVNTEDVPEKNGRWRSVPLTHPATFDTAVVDFDLKNKVKSDLESFLKSKQYYHRLGRVWKRSFLLYGPSGTGKSSFVVAMAKFLNYDVYDVNLSRVDGDSDLKMLLLQTTNKSVILIEDLDRFMIDKSTDVSLSGLLNFMDGIVSCCGEERIMVFTVNGKDQLDPSILRPGRIDVHIQFNLCDFSAFKSLANSHLGIKEHKLFPQVEEIFQTGASLSHAEIGEIMISNRSSPTRALKTVITALQTNNDARGANNKTAPRLNHNRSLRSAVEEDGDANVMCTESVHTVREFRKLYGLLRMKSRRKDSLDLDLSDKENLRHET